MKRILFITLLFVNLQIVMTEDGLSFTSMTASAQTMMYEMLDDVEVNGELVNCKYGCGVRLCKRDIEAHEESCPERMTECRTCHQSYKVSDGHDCMSKYVECPICRSQVRNEDFYNGRHTHNDPVTPPVTPSGGSSGGGSGKPTQQYEYEICEYKTGKLSQYDHNRLNSRDLVVLSDGDEDNTLTQVCKLMSERTTSTKKEIAAIKLKDGNYVIFHDENNTNTSSYIKHDASNSHTYKGQRIKEFYHTHPDRYDDETNPLNISDSDIKTANTIGCSRIYIVYPDGSVSYVYKDKLDAVY